MKTLRDYITESQQWMVSPAEGDDFAIELPDEVLVETYIIEVADDCILLDATPEIIRAISESALLEDTDEGESGIVMETMGYGGLVGEQQHTVDPIIVKALEKMPVGLQGKGLPGDAVFDAARKALAIEYGLMRMRNDSGSPVYIRQLIDMYLKKSGMNEGNIEDLEKNIAAAPVKPIPMEEGAMKEEMWRMAERMSLTDFQEHYGYEDWIEEFWKKVNDVDEAKYQGRNVALGKPMQGDVKKFKVYVKDPKTGNVKKVNFGDKTMRIKKSNPARRKSFRARHNCANPGPRTKARYWSCRKW